MTPDASPELLVERRGPVLWLTIDREARRNAMSHGVLAGMAQAITAAQTDRSVRAIVITGAGTKAFCAGADLQSANAFTTDYSEPYGHLAQLLRVARPAMCRWSRASTVPAWPGAWAFCPCATWRWPPATLCSGCRRSRWACSRRRCSACCST
jgi:hypothetical protein